MSNQRQIQPLNPQIGFNVNSFQRQIHPFNVQPLNEIGFNVIERFKIQPLNPQIGFNVNSIQRQIQPLPANGKWIQSEFHSKKDSTIKPSYRI